MLDRKRKVARTFAHFRSEAAHAQAQAQSAKSFLAVWNRPKIVLQTLDKPASRLQSLDRELKVPRTFTHLRSDPAHAQEEAQSAKSFLAVWNRPKKVLQTLGKPASRLESLDRELKVPRTFAHFRSHPAHAQEEGQSAKSFLAVWNRPKIVLQTLGKPASRLQSLDRELKVPRTFAHLRSDPAQAQAEAQSAKSFLAVWNRPKIVLHTLDKPANRLQSLDRELKVPRTFAHLRSDPAQAQAEAQSAKSFLAVWNRPKKVLQTLGKPASCLQSLDRDLKVPRTFTHLRSDPAHAQEEAQSAKSFLAVWNRPKIVLHTLDKPANRLQSLDRELKVPRTFAHLRSDPAQAQAETQSAKSFLAVWNRPKIVLQTLGKPASRLQSLDRDLKVPRTFTQFKSHPAHAQEEAQSAKSFLAVWNRPKIVLQTLGKPASRLQSLDRDLKVPRTFTHLRSDPAHAQEEAQSAKSFLAVWNRPKIVLHILDKPANRLQSLDRGLKVPRTFAHLRSDPAQAQAETQSAKSFLAVWNRPKIVLQTLGKPASRLQSLDRDLKVPRTFTQFKSHPAHAQEEAQSAKSFLAVWNRPKIVLQTLGKPASRLQSLDRDLKVPRTFTHLRSDPAHAQEEAQSAKSFLAVWNRPKIVLHTLDKPVNRLQSLDRELKVPRTFANLRSDPAQAQAEAQSAKSFLAVWNRPKKVLQTLGKPASCLQSLDRDLKVPRTFTHLRSDPAHAQEEAQSAKSFLAVWNRPKIVLHTLDKPANRLQSLDRELKVPRTFAHLRSDPAQAQAETQSAKSFLAVWNRPKIVLQTLGKPASRLQSLDRDLKVPRTFTQFKSHPAHAQEEAQSAKSFLAVWNRPKIVLQTLGKPASRLQSLDRDLKVPRTFTHLRSDPAHAQEEAQSAKSFLAVWNRPKIVLHILDKPANRLQSLDRGLKVPRTFAHLRSDPAQAQAETQSAKSFLAVWNRPKIVLQTLGKPASRLQSLDRDLKVPRTFTQFKSHPAHAQEEAQSAKSFLAVWNRPKIVLQTLGKPASRLQSLDRDLKVPRTFTHLRSDPAHAQEEAQSAKSFLAVWNRPKIVLHTLDKPVNRLQSLDRELKVPRTFAHLRSDPAQAQAEAQSAKSFLAVWNRPKIVLQTLGKPASRLQSLDRDLKVPRTFTQFKSHPAHAQEEAQSAKSFLAVWNRPKIVLQTLGKPASRLQSLDRDLKVPRTFAHFRSDPAHAQEEAQSAKSFLAVWNRPKIVLQTLGKAASRLQSLDRDLKVPRTFTHFRSDPAHAQEEAQSAKSFLAVWNRPKIVLQTLGKAASRLQSLDRDLKVPRTFTHLRSDPAHAQEEAQSAKSFLAVWNRPKIVLHTLDKPANRLQSLDRELKVPRTFANLRSDPAQAQAEAQSAKSFLAVWNRPKIVLQTLGKPASRLQSSDRDLKVPRTFTQFKSHPAHAQEEAQSAKSFLAVWNRPKIVLQTLGKPASRLQSLDRDLKVPRTFAHLRSDPAHAQEEAQSAKSFLAVWNRPKIVLQTLGKPASRLQSLDRDLKVPRTFTHFRSDPAHAQEEAQSAKSFLAVWNRPKIVLHTLDKPANRLQSLDRELKVPRTFAHLRSDPAHAQAEAQSAKSFLAVWNRPKIVLQTLGKPASRLQSSDRDLKVPRTFTQFKSHPAHAQEEAQSAKSFLAVWNRPKIVLQTLGKPASRLQSLDRDLKVPRTFAHFRSDPAHAQE